MNILDLQEVVKLYSEGKDLQVGDKVSRSTVTQITDSTVTFLCDDGYTCTIQIPWIDENGSPTKVGQRVLEWEDDLTTLVNSVL